MFLPKLWFFNPSILATRCRKPLIFQTIHFVRSNSLSLKFRRFTTFVCIDIAIRKFGFAAKIQFLSFKKPRLLDPHSLTQFFKQRNWKLASNTYFLIILIFQPNNADLPAWPFRSKFDPLYIIFSLFYTFLSVFAF